MSAQRYNMLRFFDAGSLIAMENAEILCEASIDDYHYKVTLNPIEPDSCILWFRDARISLSFNALGRFSFFEKRKVLDFIVRYSTNAELRRDIEHKKFERRISNIAPSFFKTFHTLSPRQKEMAYRNLYDLDAAIEKGDLARRRRIMARKFHPDAGGDGQAMSVINEAYEYLLTRARS